MLMVFLMAQALSCAGAQGQSDLTRCSGDAAKRADAALNVQWGRTLAVARKQDVEAAGDASRSQGPSYGDALLAAQRAWLQYRDAECRIEGYAARGGSMQPMLVGDCLQRLSVERTRQLAAIAKAF